MDRQYFTKVSEDEATKWVEANRNKLPKILKQNDQVRLMPTWKGEYDGKERYAVMLFNRKTLEPLEECLTLTRVERQSGLNTLLIWSPNMKKWYTFCMQDDNIKIWFKLNEKFQCFQDWNLE